MLCLCRQIHRKFAARLVCACLMVFTLSGESIMPGHHCSMSQLAFFFCFTVYSSFHGMMSYDTKLFAVKELNLLLGKKTWAQMLCAQPVRWLLCGLKISSVKTKQRR